MNYGEFIVLLVIYLFLIPLITYLQYKEARGDSIGQKGSKEILFKGRMKILFVWGIFWPITISFILSYLSVMIVCSLLKNIIYFFDPRK